ncbi:hypothetical protein M513_13328 [Trichuris suis]|uniref:Lipoma HMGIC fusion partner-like protein n=1 Tax=Trichuris suis TaxID=68888 RepID=A0A085LLE7_9BILA|nr:hypothetical protein M513_13328 [Trichuris suis]
MVSSSLTTTGYAWSTLSALSAAIAAFGFYMPYWLKGELTLHQQTIPAYFNSFRRCNYPGAIQPTSYESFRQVIITKCGRYATFDDIPTLWWKITTIVVGIGASLTIFTAIITLSACCTRDVITRTTARIIGIFQILAAMFICVGCLMYPLGWGNKEAKEACGRQAGPYSLGKCKIGYAYCILLIDTLLLFVCAVLSTTAAKKFDWNRLNAKEPTNSSASITL